MLTQLELEKTSWSQSEKATLQQLVAKGELTEALAKQALDINYSRKTHLRDILAAFDDINLKDYASSLAEVSSSGYASAILDTEFFAYDLDYIRQFDPALMARWLFVPLQSMSGIVSVLTVDPNDLRLEDWIREHDAEVEVVVPLVGTERDIKVMLKRAFGEQFLHKAVNSLKEQNPRQSASKVFTDAQLVVIAALVTLLVVCLMFNAMETGRIIVVLISCLYMIGIAFRLVVTLVGIFFANPEENDDSLHATADEDLPVYSILVPVYKEPQVVPNLLRALANMDYPPEKLDVLLLLEEDDLETIAEAKAAAPPAYFRFIIVPTALPKTKPKACNYGLNFCRGEYVTIYDAEDIPEPDQLRKAVAAFRRGDGSLICVQAALNYFNAHENYLTRMFTLEYTYWFDYILPGLDKLRLPIPLGGTSNHFDMEKLRILGAWDPFNVTEDADLGIRAAANGYTVGVIRSTTYEEANKKYGNWIRQRSRWIKGYMQTWLVHNRNPMYLLKKIGLKDWLSYQLLIGGTVWVFLINPLMWSFFIIWILFQPGWMSELFRGWVWDFAFFSLIFGNGVAIFLNAIASLNRKQYKFFLFSLTNPIYWILHSIASYKGLWQLIKNPFYWEKTTHGLTNVHVGHLLESQEEKSAEAAPAATPTPTPA
jgi:cellulose synthase/poly-beta-1,6-N-acetylglucosamine synthase-like glycosyltransferase